MSRGRARRRLHDLLLLLLSSALTLLAIEVGFRHFWTPHEAHQILDARGRNLYVPDAELGHRMLPEFVGSNFSSEFKVEIRTNSAGYRDDEFGALGPGALRALALGDSIVFGYGAQRGETIPDRLEMLLAQRGPRPVEVLNLGCSGYGQGQAATQLVRELPRWRPGLVLVFFFLGNDPDDNLEFYSTAQGNAIAGLPQREPWSFYKRLRHGVYSRSRLAQFLAIRSWGQLMRWGLVESSPAKEIALMQTPPDARSEAGWRVTAQYLAEIRDLCRRHGASALVVALPSKCTVNDEVFERGAAYYGLDHAALDRDAPERRLLALCAELGLDALSLVEPLREGVAAREPLYYEVDPHPTPLGLRLIAELLADPSYDRLARPEHEHSQNLALRARRELIERAADRLISAGLALSRP